MRQRLHIAIVGAGTAGLAAALLLHRQGHRIHLIERFEAARPVGSGIILQPTGLAVLQALGLAGTMLALGSRIDRLWGTNCDSGRTVLDVRYAARPDGSFGLGVHRAALFSTLYDAVQDEEIEIETGREAVTVDRGERTGLADADGRSIGTFDLVVDASGSRSRLRSALPGTREPKQLAYGAWWAALDRRPGFDDNALTQRYRRANVMIGVLPIGRVQPAGTARTAFFWSLKPGTAVAVRSAGLERWKEEVAGLWPQVQPYLDQIASFDDLTLASYGHHTLGQPASRSLAVIGDAAHSTSPQLGQGANMALLDAWALARAIDQSGTLGAALEAYCSARRWHVRLFQALSAAFTPFYQSDSTLLPLVRDLVVAPISKTPPAPRLLAAMVSGTLLDPITALDLPQPDWPTLRTKAN